MTGVWEQSPWWEVLRYGKEAPQKLNILHIFLISFAISYIRSECGIVSRPSALTGRQIQLENLEECCKLSSGVRAEPWPQSIFAIF